MRSFISLLLMTTICSIASAAEIDKPFGITMGQQLASFEVASRDKDARNSFVVRSVPKPYPGITSYMITATDEVGVCAVSGYARLGDFNKMSRAIQILRDQISEVVGQPTLLPGDRTPETTAIWLWGSPNDRLPQGGQLSPISQITLHQYEQGNKRGFSVKFEFVNRRKCEPPAPPNPFK